MKFFTPVLPKSIQERVEIPRGDQALAAAQSPMGPLMDFDALAAKARWLWRLGRWWRHDWLRRKLAMVGG